MPGMSSARAGWIMGVWIATFLVTAAVEGRSGSDGSLFTFWVIIVSVLPLLVVHEVGHAIAAVVVGYKVTGMSITSGLDGWTEWECPPGRESTGRTAVAVLGGPVLTVIGVLALFLLDLHGSAAAWRAGLVTFGILWTFDLLAPIPRVGIARDGYALMELLRHHGARRGEVSTQERATLDHIDRMLLEGKAQAAMRSCELLSERLDQTALAMWAAVLARMALAELLSGKWLVAGGEADRYSLHALTLAPQDPVTAVVRAAVAARLGVDRGPMERLRAPTPGEARVIALVAGSGRERGWPSQPARG